MTEIDDVAFPKPEPPKFRGGDVWKCVSSGGPNWVVGQLYTVEVANTGGDRCRFKGTYEVYDRTRDGGPSGTAFELTIRVR